jgi:HEAT repeat protein
MRHASPDMAPDPTGTSTEALLQRVIAEATASDGATHSYWEAVRLLQSRAPNEVWALLQPLAVHADPRLRALVPDVLRFLGGKEQPLREANVELLRGMLARNDAPKVIAAIATAFVDLHHPSALELLRPFASHPDARVREAVVHGILPMAQQAIDELIRLSSDEDPEVRSWATFGLASELGERGDPDFVDTPEVRSALTERLNDSEAETRREAARGLAIRGVHSPV